MRNPTPKQVQKVIATLEKAQRKTRGETGYQYCAVDMSNPHVHCGTPMCHGGYYALARGYFAFEYGAKFIADDLGFKHETDLMVWARDNSEIWGNRYGVGMFSVDLAFGGTEYLKEKGLQGIIDHWKGVKKRLIALQ